MSLAKSYKSLGDASVIHTGGRSVVTGTTKATSVSNLVFNVGSVIIVSPIKETKGEVTSVNKTKKERNEESTYQW